MRTYPNDAEWHLGQTTTFVCPPEASETNLSSRSVYVEGRPRKLWIPAGSIIPAYQRFDAVIQTIGQDWITGNPSDTRYYVSYSTVPGTMRDATAPNIPLTLKCGTSRYYNEATITGLEFVSYPETSLITLEADLILYEE